MSDPLDKAKEALGDDVEAWARYARELHLMLAQADLKLERINSPNPADHRYWEGRYRDEAERNEKLEEMLAELRQTAALLLQNAVGCAIDHHSVDFESEGLPGWLADCQDVIDRANEMIPVPDPEPPNMSGTEPTPYKEIY